MSDKIVMFPCTPCAPFQFKISYDWSLVCPCEEFMPENKDDAYNGSYEAITSSLGIASTRGSCYPHREGEDADLYKCIDFGAVGYYECAGLFHRVITNAQVKVLSEGVVPGLHRIKLKKIVYRDVHNIQFNCEDLYEQLYLFTEIEVIDVVVLKDEQISADIPIEIPLGYAYDIFVEYCGCGCDDSIKGSQIFDSNI